ncbi:hypothetical protein GE09DRAFT_1077536 [Coniochaeta sp. 2T2.1]|nr:hypothetical protein GE09DRAFT_1077536 [Coniochaeta sp. 2T2.1]
MAADPKPKPKAPFNPLHRSPTLKKLLKQRPAPIRERELIAKAICPDRPVKPAPGDCCGSSCHPCVMDNYAEELKVWRECWVKWEGGVDGEVPGEEKRTVEGKSEDEKAGGMKAVDGKENVFKVPGAFEW